jgi:hypothetical protein
VPLSGLVVTPSSHLCRSLLVITIDDFGGIDVSKNIPPPPSPKYLRRNSSFLYRHKIIHPINSTMVLRKKGGIGAVGNPYARYIHPSGPIRQRWPNTWKQHQCMGAVICGKGMRNVSRRNQLCYEIRLTDFEEDVMFHIVCCNFKVLTEGPEPFDDERTIPQVAPAPILAQIGEGEAAASNVDDGVVLQLGNLEIGELTADGIQVDDEGPAPENAIEQEPIAGEVGDWEAPLICVRRNNSAIKDTVGRWADKSWKQVGTMTELAIYRVTFPEEYIKSVMIPATNAHLPGEKLTLNEFYVWLGCRFFMACFVGEFETRAWWSKKSVSLWEGAPFRLRSFMELERFEAINRELRLTNKDTPSFEDKFYQVRELQGAFNDHYKEKYSPSWLSCLDESMSPWTNKYCPGYMFVPRKPHPFGNEYHTIADGDQGKPIMWRAKVQEGKDRPMDGNTPRYPSQFEMYSTTAKLMLDMAKPIFNTGKIITMDSGFCVTAGILALHDHGVFGQALIKKRGRFWPVHCPGDQIDRHFDNKAIGDTDSLSQVIDGKNFYIHCTKDDGYVTKIMSTHGTLREISTHRTRRVVNGQVTTFNYTEPISRHNTAKHYVDDVNNRRHDPIGLDAGWATKKWEHRQLTFFLSVAEVNAINSQARGRNAPAVPTLVFRKKLARQMIENKLNDDGIRVNSPMKPKKRDSDAFLDEHHLDTRPNFTGAWDENAKKFRDVGTKYCKTVCATCPRLTRRYCRCNRRVSMCYFCFADHKS